MVRRSSSRQKRGGAARKIAVASPYIKRQIPFTEYATEDALIKIEGQANWILKEIGIEFTDDPIALEIWQDAGVDVKGTRVRFDTGEARALLATAPREFTQYARNPERNVVIGGNNQVFAPVYGAPFVMDIEKGRRYGTLEDLQNLVRLTAKLPSLHHSGFVTCEPCDIPVNKRHLDMVAAHMIYSDKPMLGAITAKSRAEDSVEMAKILFGTDFTRDHCVMMGNVNTNSPLLVDKVVTEAIRTYSAQGQGMIVAPFILSGAMGPVTTAGSIAQAFAEAMACGAFSQLVAKGSPFVMGNFLSSMSLKTGAPTFGMPEPTASNYIIGQMARRLNIPLRCGGSLTASKLPDAQAAAESADSMHSTAMAGANFVLHSAGWLEGGLVTGYEKLIIDADRLGGYQKLLAGIATDDDSLGRNAYDDVEPAGHFLGSSHTLAHYETAFYEASMSNADSFEKWFDDGGKDTAQRAHECWKKMLDEYEAPAMDEAKRDEINAFVARRKAEMPDAWY